MKFVFRTLLEYKEMPAAVMARKVAEILKNRGHSVRIIETPKELRSERLYLLPKPEKPADPKFVKAVTGFLDKSADYGESLHKLGRKDEHIIDFHNSSTDVFYPPEKRRLHEYPASFYRHKLMAGVCDSPISFLLHEETSDRLEEGKKPKRLVATLELPAVAREAHLNTVKKREAFLDLVPPSVPDLNLDHFMLMFDYHRKIRRNFFTSDSEKAGLLSGEFARKIADELEKAAAAPHELKTVPDAVLEELDIASELRDKPFLAEPGSVKSVFDSLSKAKRELAEFRAYYKTQAGRFPDSKEERAEFMKKLKKLNAKQEELLRAADEAKQTAETAARVHSYFKKAGGSPKALLQKYGLQPHFYKP